jgi:hypothetical protein
MSVDSIIWVMTTYVFVYYAVARHALAILIRQDRDYFDAGDRDGRLSVGMKTSTAIVEMLFDSDLPGGEFGSMFRYELYIARAMLLLFLPVFLALAYVGKWA